LCVTLCDSEPGELFFGLLLILFVEVFTFEIGRRFFGQIGCGGLLVDEVREPTTERRLDRPDTADEAFLHQRHREADSGLVELFRAVVNILDVVGDRSVELALLVGHLDRDGSDITVREDALAVVVIDSLLAAAHHHAVDCFLREVLVFGDEERVDVLDERPERFALAVVWRRAEQEQRIGVVSHSFDHLRRFARGLAALGCLVCLVDDHDVPERVVEFLAEFFLAEERHARDHLLVVLVPDVRLLAEAAAFALDPLPISWCRADVEEAVHIANPLLLEVGWDDEQDAVGAVACGELFEDESRLDGFPQPDVVRNERSLAEFLHHPVHAGELVRFEADERVRDTQELPLFVGDLELERL